MSEPNRARLINVGMWIVLIPTVMIVATKLYTKWSTARKFSLDDLLIVVSFGFAIAQSVAITEQIDGGFGMHQIELSQSQLDYIQKIAYTSQIFYVVCINLSKLSTLSFFPCLCNPHTVRMVYSVSAITTVWFVISVFTLSFQCQLPDTWEFLSGRCINLNAFWIANLVMDVLLQLTIAFLPVLLLRNLQMASKSKKWLSMLAFTPNLVTVPLSILRLVFLVQVTENSDYTYDSYNVTVVTALHAFIAVAAAALSFIKPVIDSLVIQPYLVDETLASSAGTPHMGNFASKFRRTTRDARLASQIKQNTAATLSNASSLPSSAEPRKLVSEDIGLGNLTAVSSGPVDHDGSAFDFGLRDSGPSRDGSTDHMVIRQTSTILIESQPK